MEKRLPIAMVVNLASAQLQGGDRSELTYTNNISAHGACVVSTHPWQPGEIAELTSLDQISIRGRVVHCRKQGKDQYVIGLNFQNCNVAWSTYQRYAGPAQETIPLGQKLAR